jgi:TPR repeat protein
VQAEVELGWMYDKGQGVPQNYSAALQWYRLAAAQGNADAQSNLGVKYASGQGVARDDVTALNWYRLAAAQGNADAQSNLSLMYSKGQGVQQDYVHAYMWSNLAAAAAGNADAVKNRDRVATLMTPPQIAQAQKMARDCQQRKFEGCD